MAKRAAQLPPARFFRNAAELRRWFERHHDCADELHVGYYKRHSPKFNYSWPESVDEALCFGWIDGVRHSVDGDRYRIRFTPRRTGSKWSAVNLKRIEELKREKRVHPAGLAALAAWRKRAQDAGYSHELESVELDTAYVAALRANRAAWKYYQAQAPGYRRKTAHWVMSAKRAETRERRLATLIEDCAEGRPIKPFSIGKTTKRKPSR